jgi:hypothetical protein
MKYIKIGCDLASNSEMTPQLIQNGLIDTILDIFESDDFPEAAYAECIFPIAAFAKTDVGRAHLKKRNFDLRRYAVKLDKIEDPKIHKAGVNCIKNMATEADLDRALKGLENLNEDDITFFSYLALCDNLVPIMVERDIVQKILDVLEKLMDRADAGAPLKKRAIKNLTKTLTTICNIHNPSIDRFLGLDGFKTVSRLLD